MKYFIVLMVTIVAPVICYEAGAPTQACVDMTPQHGVPPKTSGYPYHIQLSANQIRSGEAIQVTLIGSPENKLKGFMVQGRVGGQPVGHFEENQYVQAIDCGSGRGNAATHRKINGDGLESISMNWIAPAGLSEKVQFQVTTVKDGGTYWINQKSDFVTVN